MTEHRGGIALDTRRWSGETRLEVSTARKRYPYGIMYVQIIKNDFIFRKRKRIIITKIEKKMYVRIYLMCMYCIVCMYVYMYICTYVCMNI